MSLKNVKSKYILEILFQYINKKTYMEIVKYNKQLMSKLSITKYDYQKYFFNSIITPFYLENISLLQKYFDEKTLEILKSEWDEQNELIEHNYKAKTDINRGELESKIIKINKHNESTLNKLVKSTTPNIIELNLSDIDKIKIPCSILLNIQKLILKNISIEFISKGSNISLNKLIYLETNNINVKKDKIIKIKMNNLKYLYVTIKNVNVESPGNALLYYEFYSKIFGFSFIKTLLGKLGDNEKECSKELFQEKYIDHLKYLNLKIFKEADRERYAPSSHETERYCYYIGYDFNYIFSKTKGNNYYFETKHEIGNEHDFEIKIKDIRYSHNINYNDYYFKNKKISIWDRGGDDFDGYYGYDLGFKNMFDDLNKFKIKSVNINHHVIISPRERQIGCDDERSEDLYVDSRNLLNLFEYVKKDNNLLEVVSIAVLDTKCYPEFIKKIKYLLGLKIFYVTDDCIISNSQLNMLFENLSLLKNLFEIELNFCKKLKLNEKVKQNIRQLFPKININKKSIVWKKE